MAVVFTNVGEFHRGKGNRGTRFGPRMRMGAEAQDEGRKTATPDRIATNKLYKLLDKPGMSPKDREAYRSLMLRAEQVRFMNMEVLAQAILYIHQHGWELTCQPYNPKDPANRNSFNYLNILNYVEPLIERQYGDTRANMTEDDLSVVRLRLAATIFRYIVYVINVKSQNVIELEQTQEPEGTIPDVI